MSIFRKARGADEQPSAPKAEPVPIQRAVQQSEAASAGSSVPLAGRKFSVIYADPPWNYADKSCTGGIGFEYAGMDLPAICALPVSRIAADDALLFLWTTWPFLFSAEKVIEAWGFHYVSIAFVWVKTYKNGQPFYGLGRWTRGNTEPCLLAKRGKPKRENADVFQLIKEEVLEAQVTRHSAKPPEVRDRVVRLVGDVPRVELFARARVPGWAAWGNDPSIGKVDVEL